MVKKSGLFLGVMILVLFIPNTISAEDKTQSPVIEVTGHAVMTAPPTHASIILSVENTDTKADIAIKKNAEITGKVIAAMKKSAGRDATITTSNFTIQPMYDRDSDLSDKVIRITPRSYRVENPVFLKTSKIDRIGAFIDAAVTAGSSRVGSISFSRDDKEQLQKQAAAKALENAIDCAKKLAKTAGYMVKRIKFIQYVPANMDAGNEGPVQTQEDESSQAQIIPEELSFESYVSITCDLGQ
jgi:uncharacterized protein